MISENIVFYSVVIVSLSKRATKDINNTPFYIKTGTIHYMKKRATLGVLILFCALAWVPVNGIAYDPSFSCQPYVGSIYYVGGNGPNNYTTIQGAINQATDGETVFVFALSSPYYEHVVVNKSLYLIGENQTTTVIDGSASGDVVLVTADETTISGFTLQHSGDLPKVNAGVECRSDRDVIQGNIVKQNGRFAVGVLLNGSSGSLVRDNYIDGNGNEGIFVGKSTDTLITENLIVRNGHCAVVVSQSTHTTIIQNMMHDNYAGVSLWPGATDNEITRNSIMNQSYSGIGIWPGAHNNSIHQNLMRENGLYGFIITRANDNAIVSNTIQGNNEGMRLFMANTSLIQGNNFIDNNVSVYFENSSLNRWKQNYWDDHLSRLPKCIHGLMRIPWDKKKVIHWINIDWRPAQTPYDIPGFEEVLT